MSLPTTTITWGESIARDGYPTGVNLQIIGRASIGAGTLSDLTPITAGFQPVLGAPVAFDVISSSANDDGAPAGTGINTVRIVGLGAAAVLQAETVTLNGTNAVALAQTYTNILSVYALTVGSAGGAAGTVAVFPNGAFNVYRQINPGGLRDEEATYQIPAGRFGLITSISGAGSPDLEVQILAGRRPMDDVDPSSAQSLALPQVICGDAGQTILSPPLRVEAGAVVSLQVRNTSGAALNASASLGLITATR